MLELKFLGSMTIETGTRDYGNDSAVMTRASDGFQGRLKLASIYVDGRLAHFLWDGWVRKV
jgi:hypothetical protein